MSNILETLKTVRSAVDRRDLEWFKENKELTKSIEDPYEVIKYAVDLIERGYTEDAKKLLVLYETTKNLIRIWASDMEKEEDIKKDQLAERIVDTIDNFSKEHNDKIRMPVILRALEEVHNVLKHEMIMSRMKTKYMADIFKDVPTDDDE